MPADGEERTVRQALAQYFRASGLPEDGGYSAAWFWIRVGPISLPMPNIVARRGAVRYHDLHHLLTGYDTSWRGEAAIGAWELGSGCGRYWVGWVLDLAVLPVGLLIAPRATFAAFCRGRRSENLFGRDYEALLPLTVAELRSRVRIAGPEPTPRPSDCLLFLAFLLAAIAPLLLLLAALVVLLRG